jgi:hypothetical protein
MSGKGRAGIHMLTIVWDVDDVLNELMKNWFEHAWLHDHPACTLRYETITQNPPHELLGVTREEYLESLDAFRLSELGRTLTPNEETTAWFRTHGRRFRHVALTATPILSAPYSAAWVFRYFGEWIRTFAFVPSKRTNDPELNYDTTKKEYLQWWGKADILVDDSPIHIEAAQQLRIKTVLVPRPWNDAPGTIADTLLALSNLSSTVNVEDGD